MAGGKLVVCQSCSTLRQGEKPGSIPGNRNSLKPCFNLAANLHCGHCKKVLYENAADQNKTVPNLYTSEIQKLLVAASGDMNVALEDTITAVHSNLAAAKSKKVQGGPTKGQTPSFLQQPFLSEEMDDFSIEYVKNAAVTFAMKPQIPYTGNNSHAATDIRTNPKPSLVDGLTAMILIDTLKKYDSLESKRRLLCSYCQRHMRYAKGITNVVSWKTSIGCSQCILGFAQQYRVGNDNDNIAIIPGQFGRPDSIVCLKAEGEATVRFKEISFSVILSHAMTMDNTLTLNPSQVIEDEKKFEAKRES